MRPARFQAKTHDPDVYIYSNIVIHYSPYAHPLRWPRALRSDDRCSHGASCDKQYHGDTLLSAHRTSIRHRKGVPIIHVAMALDSSRIPCLKFNGKEWMGRWVGYVGHAVGVLDTLVIWLFNLVYVPTLNSVHRCCRDL